jgi:hypothetical protein
VSPTDFRDSQTASPATIDAGGRAPSTLRSRIPSSTIALVSVCVLIVILVAGLWPFHAPKNGVSWLKERKGIFFGKHGSILSAKPFESNSSQSAKSCSLEIWLEPSRVDRSGAIVAFYVPARRVVSFELIQWRGNLVLESESPDPVAKRAHTYFADVFRPTKPIFLTISSSQAGTVLYVDGTLVKRNSNFSVSNRDLTGQLIIGNEPSTLYDWSGKVMGLAVYDRELSPSEVEQDFANWTKGNQPDWTSNHGVTARYTFEEGTGSVARNDIDSATNLLIPEQFFVFHEQFLERPWDEFHADWHYWKDVGINVGGFIPLGFFFSAYLFTTGKIKRTTWLTIVLGFTVSFTIEVLQAFLPTRKSGMTDIITNTFGTATGAILWTCAIQRNWFERMGLSGVLFGRERKG